MERESQAPVFLVANHRSGQGQADRIVHELTELCAQQQRALTCYLVSSGRQLAPAIRRAALAARRVDGRVVVAGGDGSVRLAAQYLSGSGVPLAIIPAGTFNLFARNLGIPLHSTQAAKLALQGSARPVTLGSVNGQLFLNNASFGLYSRLIRAREQHSRRFGRHQLVAIASTLATLLKGYRAMALDLQADGERTHLRSPMVFVGINTLQLRGLSLAFARCREQHQMAVLVMKPVGWRDLLRLTLKGLMRRLEDERSLRRYCVSRLEIHPDRRRISVVLDGERMRMGTPLVFELRPDALQLIQPEPH